MSDVNMSSSSVFKEQHHGMLIIKFLNGEHFAVDPKDNIGAVCILSLIFTINVCWSLQQVLRLAVNFGLLRESSESAGQKDVSWRIEINQESASLAEETDTHGDVLMVDMIDVYRNLPYKLLLCHRWFHEHYTARFVLKTDDDCFLNLPLVLGRLSKKQYGDDESIWWGNFRRNWVVERHGKWKEDRFTSPVYPDFACGSGNLVSRHVHSLLVSNLESLNLYQGEDVSMGIWMSAFDARRVHDTRWRCTKSCTDDTMALPQLDAESVVWYWNNSKRCPSSCQSCTGT